MQLHDKWRVWLWMNMEKNDVLQELLKSEYDLAKHECEYYTQEFNKQDTVYGVYFAEIGRAHV